MKKSSKEAKEQWKSFFQGTGGEPVPTVQQARDKLIQYQNYCRQQDPHSQLVPGYDMLAWVGVPMSQSMHKIRLNEVYQMKKLIPKLTFKELKVLYHRLKTNWTSKIFRSLCIDILKRIAVHREFTKFSQKIIVHHASLHNDVKDIPMKFLQQLWANDQHLSGTLQCTVFERFFRPLIQHYILDSQKGIQYTNIVQLVHLSKKSVYLNPNEIRGQNKNLTKRILYFLSGNQRDKGDVHMHKILVRKFLHLIRKMYCESNNPTLGALRCDIIIALKEDHKNNLVETGEDRCHELIEVVDNVRKLQYISVETLKSLKRKVGQILSDKICLNLNSNQSSDIPGQLIFKTLEGSEITVAQEARKQREQHLGVQGYPASYAKIKKFEPDMHTFTASENQVMKTIARKFKMNPVHMVRMNQGYNLKMTRVKVSAFVFSPAEVCAVEKNFLNSENWLRNWLRTG